MKLYQERDEQLSIASQEEQPVLQGTEVKDRPADQKDTRQGEEDCPELGMEDTILVKSPRPVFYYIYISCFILNIEKRFFLGLIGI